MADQLSVPQMKGMEDVRDMPDQVLGAHHITHASREVCILWHRLVASMLFTAGAAVLIDRINVVLLSIVPIVLRDSGATWIGRSVRKLWFYSVGFSSLWRNRSAWLHQTCLGSSSYLSIDQIGIFSLLTT